MPISGRGWEIHFVRQSVQRRESDGKKRTVGIYKVFHDGVAQTGADMSGMCAESRGPGANRPGGNGRRVEQGSYPLSTQDGSSYCTIGYTASANSADLRRPSLELRETEERTEILIHPGRGFLSSIGCINLCTRLPDGRETIDYVGSRRRVIAVIDDLKAFLGGDFPSANGRKIPKAFAVIDGEP